MPESSPKLHITPAALQDFLTGAGEFLEPQRLLGDLTPAQACAVPPGALYSIAQVVAHMHYWQERGILRARGVSSPRPAHLDDTFPTPLKEDWEELRAAFLDGLARCSLAAAEYGDQTSREQPGRTIAYDLAECPALHSAYHYGQISILRQLQGLWPPTGGDDSW